MQWFVSCEVFEITRVRPIPWRFLRQIYLVRRYSIVRTSGEIFRFWNKIERSICRTGTSVKLFIALFSLIISLIVNVFLKSSQHEARRELHPDRQHLRPHHWHQWTGKRSIAQSLNYWQTDESVGICAFSGVFEPDPEVQHKPRHTQGAQVQDLQHCQPDPGGVQSDSSSFRRPHPASNRKVSSIYPALPTRPWGCSVRLQFLPPTPPSLLLKSKFKVSGITSQTLGVACLECPLLWKTWTNV